MKKRIFILYSLLITSTCLSTEVDSPTNAFEEKAEYSSPRTSASQLSLKSSKEGFFASPSASPQISPQISPNLPQISDTFQTGSSVNYSSKADFFLSPQTSSNLPQSSGCPVKYTSKDSQDFRNQSPRSPQSSLSQQLIDSSAQSHESSQIQFKRRGSLIPALDLPTTINESNNTNPPIDNPSGRKRSVVEAIGLACPVQFKLKKPDPHEKHFYNCMMKLLKISKGAEGIFNLTDAFMQDVQCRQDDQETCKLKNNLLKAKNKKLKRTNQIDTLIDYKRQINTVKYEANLKIIKVYNNVSYKPNDHSSHFNLAFKKIYANAVRLSDGKIHHQADINQTITKTQTINDSSKNNVKQDLQVSFIRSVDRRPSVSFDHLPPEILSQLAKKNKYSQRPSKPSLNNSDELEDSESSSDQDDYHDISSDSETESPKAYLKSRGNQRRRSSFNGVEIKDQTESTSTTSSQSASKKVVAVSASKSVHRLRAEEIIELYRDEFTDLKKFKSIEPLFKIFLPKILGDHLNAFFVEGLLSMYVYFPEPVKHKQEQMKEFYTCLLTSLLESCKDLDEGPKLTYEDFIAETEETKKYGSYENYNLMYQTASFEQLGHIKKRFASASHKKYFNLYNRRVYSALLAEMGCISCLQTAMNKEFEC